MGQLKYESIQLSKISDVLLHIDLNVSYSEDYPEFLD